MTTPTQKQAVCDSTNPVVQKLFAADDKPERTQHTPGPWKAEGWTVQIGDGYADQIEVCVGDTHLEAEANACLIAAAPDLLAALRDLRAAALRNGFESEMANRAIAKAEGRAQ